MPSPNLVAEIQGRRTPTLVSVDGRTYPLQSAHVQARAEGGLAGTTLIQEFTNPYDEPLEVIYTMPLPADGAVLGYTIRMGEKIIRGEIQPREKAEADYKKALYEGRSAGLLEQDRADTFLQRLGNLPPHTNVTVTIEILQPLAFLAGSGETGPVWEYRFPTVVSARYEGAPGRVPDADRLDVNRDAGGGIPTRFGLTITVADDLTAAGSIVSKSHEVVGVSNGAGTSVRLAENSRLDRDFVLQWPASTGEVGVQIAEGRGLPGDDGRYAALSITPPRVAASAYLRDLTVLIDASGSMQGMPLVLTKRVVSSLLRSLESGDRFEVLAFANDTRRLSRDLEDATPEAVERCIQAIGALTAGGGTEMAQALDEALAPLRQESQRQVVLVSDGQIGFEDEIFAKMGPRLPAGVRVHAVGIGSAPNRALTSGVARAGRGVELVAGDEESANEAARRICAATVRPVLTDLTVTGTAVRGSAPAMPRDVFAGAPIAIAAELQAGGGMLQVSGHLAGSDEVWIWRMEVPVSGGAAAPGVEVGDKGPIRSTTLPIGALYGREAILDVEMHLAGSGRHGDFSAVDRSVEALGMRHRITSRRTSLVAIADEPSVDPKKPRRRERLAVEMPHGVSAEGLGYTGELVFGYMERGVYAASPHRSFALSLDSVADRRGRAPLREPRGYDPLRALFSRLIGRDKLAELPVGPAILVRLEGQEAVFEFGVPLGDFYLPDGEVTVVVEGHKVGTARVLPEKSTARGPHASGLIVRIALRLGRGATWPKSGLLELTWKVPAEMLGGRPAKTRFLLVYVFSATASPKP